MKRMKTNKGANSRLKVTATGKVMHKRTYGGHLMSKKSGDRCRNTRRSFPLGNALAVKYLERLTVCAK